MELKFSKIVDRDKKTAEMFLYGVLGDNYSDGEINGHYFAQELNWLGKNYDEITIRENCDGGSVSHGLSVVSEMMQSTAFITVKVDGIAASMGAVILAGADKVLMNDYAKVMIHSPYYVDDNGDAIKNLSEKDKKGLESIKSTLISLLVKRGIDEKRIGELMKTDSWFTADEAKTEGLVDEVITTGKKKEFAALEPKRLVALLMNENEHNCKIDMKKVIAKLNLLGAKLTDDATEDQIIAAVDAYVKPAEIEPSAPSQKLIDKLIEAGEKAGTVTEKNKASFVALATKDVDLFCDMLNLDTVAKADDKKDEKKHDKKDNTRVSEIVSALKEAGLGKPTADKKWENHSQAELDELEAKQPEVYAALYKAHFGVELAKMK
jgi:ATP-dependent protease ClpP protease subunit